MLIKYYTDHYKLDNAYKFTITQNNDGSDSVAIYFPNTLQNGKQEVIYFSSIKDGDVYRRVVDYLLKDDVIVEYNNLEQFFD